MALAHEIADEDVERNRLIGVHGLEIIREIAEKKAPDEPVRILTHCNAGWLATVDWGTATSPIYQAQKAGIPIHVWVDETRPRNQGALTAWELGAADVSHTYITDNAGGHLMHQDLVDMVIVGSDRTTSQGDVCNKIGTYLKALAAKDNGVPFYVALPSSTIDWTVKDGAAEIPIEDRPTREVTHIYGRNEAKEIDQIQVSPDGTIGVNPAFDVTRAHLVSGLITERGIAEASSEGLAAMFPDKTDCSSPRKARK
jgi:methylthioribose-1-phosphate isomerase